MSSKYYVFTKKFGVMSLRIQEDWDKETHQDSMFVMHGDRLFYQTTPQLIGEYKPHLSRLIAISPSGKVYMQDFTNLRDVMSASKEFPSHFEVYCLDSEGLIVIENKNATFQ